MTGIRPAVRPEVGDLLVGDVTPVRVGRAGPVVEQRVAGQVRRLAIEDPERARQPLVRLGPRQHVGDAVEDERRRRLEAVEQGAAR